MGSESTMLETDAAIKTPIRRDPDGDWQADIAKLMREENVFVPDATPKDATPKVGDIKRYDRRRQWKSVSDQDRQSLSDPDSRVMQMRGGRTYLAHKVKHAVDLSNEITLSAEIDPAKTDDQANGRRSGDSTRSEPAGGWRRDEDQCCRLWPG